MNKAFDTGLHAVTCYRNSKNFGANWISAGYSIWFLREARFLNFPRILLGANCAISGTGFWSPPGPLRKTAAGPLHLLTEDIQFSVSCALKGQRIGYCEKAVVYDEQPTTLPAVLGPAAALVKGFYQVDAKYGRALLGAAFWPGPQGFPAMTC